MEKILTISVAAYNAEKYLEKCLDSFINSKSIDDLEIIVVNDGSKDETLKIANIYKKKYPKSIIVVDKENGGHGSTINASIRAASGKYFKLVDSDDWVSTSNLDKLVAKLKKTEVDLIVNPYISVNATNQEDLKLTDLNTKMMLDYNKEYCFDDVCRNLHLSMPTMTIKTDLIKKVGPIIDEKCYYVDTEYTIFPIKYIDSIMFLDYSIYYYLLGTITQSMNMKNMIKRRGEHLNVCKTLIKFFSQLNNDISITKKEVIKSRVTNMIAMQYSLFMMLGTKESVIEIKDFDTWLKNENIELYKHVQEHAKKQKLKRLKLLLSMRKNDFKYYKVVFGLINIIKRPKNL